MAQMIFSGRAIAFPPLRSALFRGWCVGAVLLRQRGAVDAIAAAYDAAVDVRPAGAARDCARRDAQAECETGSAAARTRSIDSRQDWARRESCFVRRGSSSWGMLS